MLSIDPLEHQTSRLSTGSHLNRPEAPLINNSKKAFGISEAAVSLSKQDQIADRFHSDPSTTFIVYVFLLSETGNSLGIWKRKLPIPVELQDYYARDLERVNAHVKKQQYVIAVEQ